MTQIILFILDLLKPVFRSMNIDYPQLRAIIEIKLIMDNRRQTVRFTKKQAEKNNVFLWTLIVYTIFGGFIAIGIAASNFMLGMTIFFSFLMAMVSVTLITDFSSILLDTSDNTILLPRPIDNRTFYAARTVHILLYLSQLATCLSAASCIAIIWKYKFWLVIPFIVGIFLTVLIAVFLTNTIYLLILRFANEEKIKNVINYFQIFMAIFVMGGYQIGARMLTHYDYTNTIVEIKWWSYFIPPIWISGMMDTFYATNFDIQHITITILAVIFPLASLYITNTFLTPFYNRKIVMMETTIISNTGIEKKTSTSFISSIGKLITNGTREEGTFSFVYKMLLRDNKIKLKIYPGFGLIFVFGFLFLFNNKESISSTLSNLSTTHYYILLIYLPFMVVQTALYEIPFTEDFKASWIYYSTPIEKPGELLTGMAKAIFLQLFIPIYLVISIAILFFWKSMVFDDIFFGLINNYLIFLILLTINTRYLPLSMAPNARSQSGNLLRGLMLLVCTGLPALGHYLLANKVWIMLVVLPFQLIAIYFLQRSYRNTLWADVKF